jgi:hypothetical protein
MFPLVIEWMSGSMPVHEVIMTPEQIPQDKKFKVIVTKINRIGGISYDKVVVSQAHNEIDISQEEFDIAAQEVDEAMKSDTN